MAQAPARAVPGPEGEVVVHRALRGQALGQGAPLATRGQHVEDPVQHLAHVHRAPTAAAPARRDERLDQRPLPTGRVARVAQAHAGIGPPLLDGPHRASPPWPIPTATPPLPFTNLPDGLSAPFPVTK